MTIDEFLCEMEPHNFPVKVGPWLTFDGFDPPFKRDELRAMRKAGVIELDEVWKRFRLTMQATDAMERIEKEAAE